MIDIKSMLPDRLGAYLKELGQPAFRSKQMFQWLQRGVTSFDQMTDLPKSLRETLKESSATSLPPLWSASSSPP